MNPLPKNLKSEIFYAMDFDDKSVRVICASKKTSRDFTVLSYVHTDICGVENGQIVHLGDAAESVRKALDKAQSQSGHEIRSIYFALDDSLSQMTVAKGCKVLSGEGEVKPQDIRTAIQNAERSVGRFESIIVYLKEEGFVVDDKDLVAKPLGIFASKIEALVRMMLFRADILAQWKELFERTYLSRAVPVPRIAAILDGCFGKAIPAGRFVFMHISVPGMEVFSVQDGVVKEIRRSRTAVGDEVIAGVLTDAVNSFEWQSSPDTVYVCGTRAQNDRIVDSLRSRLPYWNIQAALPMGLPDTYKSPENVALCGLLWRAELELNEQTFLKPQEGFVDSLKAKTSEFINEYF